MAAISRSSHYNWLKENTYAQAFEIAERVSNDVLRDEVVRRGVEGALHPVSYKAELPIGIRAIAIIC